MPACTSPDSGSKATSIQFWFIEHPAELTLTPNIVSELPREYDETLCDYSAEIAKKFDQQMREAQAERTLGKETEGRAASARPAPPERRYGIESRVAPETRVRGDKGRAGQ